LARWSPPPTGRASYIGFPIRQLLRSNFAAALQAPHERCSSTGFARSKPLNEGPRILQPNSDPSTPPGNFFRSDGARACAAFSARSSAPARRIACRLATSVQRPPKT
jgi:hypothetical protein